MRTFQLFWAAAVLVVSGHFDQAIAHDGRIKESLHSELYYCQFNIDAQKKSCRFKNEYGILNGSWRDFGTVDAIISDRGFGNNLLYYYTLMTTGAVSREFICKDVVYGEEYSENYIKLCELYSVDGRSDIVSVYGNVLSVDDFLSKYMITFESMNASEVDLLFGGLLRDAYIKSKSEEHKDDGDISFRTAKNFLCSVSRKTCSTEYINILNSIPSFRMAVLYQRINDSVLSVSKNREQKIWIPSQIENLTLVGDMIDMSISYNHQRNLMLSAELVPKIRSAIFDATADVSLKEGKR
jgi:hypothetical protein